MLTRINRNGIICDDIKTHAGEKYATSNAVFEAQVLAETAALNAIEAASDARNDAEIIKSSIEEVKEITEGIKSTAQNIVNEVTTDSIAELNEITSSSISEINEAVSEIKQETLNAQALAETAALEAIDAKSKSVEIKNQFDIYRNNGCVYSGDIILNGSKLLLANGASVELFTGEELPTPGGSGGDSYPLPEEPVDTSNFATLDGDNEFSGDNNFTGTLALGGKRVVTTDFLYNINWDSDITHDPYIGINNSKVPGPFIYFRRGDGGTNPGALEIVARGVEEEKRKALILKPDGTLTWAGKNITRIENSSKGTNNWYIKLDNGLIIQGGIVNAYDKTLTFPTAFSNTNYAFSIFLTATEYINNDFSVAAGKTTTGITSIRMGAGDGSYGYNGGWTHSWIAMGY